MAAEDRTLGAIKRLLWPIVRLLIARGVQLPAVVAALKQLYVEVASTDFRIDEKPPTDSRVSVLTGVHRRDVRSIRKDGLPSSASSPMSLSATVIGRWLGDPAFSKDGQPLVLNRLADEAEPSFEALFHEVSRDVHPRTILDDLINQKLVEWDEESDTVRLLGHAFVPTTDGEGLMRFFEMNLHDHLAAAVGNLLDDHDRGQFLERAVYYNRLLPASVDEIEQHARNLGDKVLSELNSTALRHQTIDQEQTEATERFRFGIFFYREDDGFNGDRS